MGEKGKAQIVSVEKHTEIVAVRGESAGTLVKTILI
jgi:hypothetical protein